MNFKSLIERDLAAIPAAVASFRAEHSAEETWTAVTRFAVLAFAPSQHSKHALLACLSTWDLRETLAGELDDAIVQCAIYAAASRQPWSEPPILTPPPFDADQHGDLAELRAAIAASDRLRAERWLAKRYRDDDFDHDVFTVASDRFDDLGHSLIVANACTRLAPLLGEQGRYAMLRVAVWEMVVNGGHGGGGAEVAASAADQETLCARLVSRVAANEGDVISAHALFLFDAALQTGNEGVMNRVARHLTAALDDAFEGDGKAASMDLREEAVSSPPVYPFAQDYGACLKGHAVAERIKTRFPSVNVKPMLAALRRNREASASGEEMTFA